MFPRCPCRLTCPSLWGEPLNPIMWDAPGVIAPVSLGASLAKMRPNCPTERAFFWPAVLARLQSCHCCHDNIPRLGRWDTIRRITSQQKSPPRTNSKGRGNCMMGWRSVRFKDHSTHKHTHTHTHTHNHKSPHNTQWATQQGGLLHLRRQPRDPMSGAAGGFSVAELSTPAKICFGNRVV